MDRHALAVLIPIIALCIPVVAIVMGGLTKMQRLKNEGAAGALGPDAESRLAALEDDVVHLRQELAETHERLDFTERLLARRDEENQLKP